MFKFALLIGIYSYIIFFLGVFGLLYKNLIDLITISFFGFTVIFFFRSRLNTDVFRNKKISNLSKIIIFLFISQILVNFIGVLGPEISFDALWYHLTLPKLYLGSHSIFHITGGLLYYSDMPKLIEMLYVGALTIGNEITAKFIHFCFGLLICFVVFRISRKYISVELSLISVLIFYSNLVIGWESISSYIDLARTFFEIMAFWGYLIWNEKRKLKFLIISSLMLGLAITTKVVAIGSLFVFVTLLIFNFCLNKKKLRSLFKNIFIFVFFSFIVPLPWFIFAYFNTGNPFYPFFSLPVDSGNFLIFPNLINFPTAIWRTFLSLNDPISPIYFILLPLVVIFVINYKVKIKQGSIYVFIIYSIMSFFIWYFFQENRGGRFLLPYLPIFSILTAFMINNLKNKNLKQYLIAIVVFIALISVGYRGLANKKFIPVILGAQSKQEFLTKNLNFKYGEFYDTDNYFKTHLKNSDKVLLYGFHNLYYVDFSFIDSSWVKKGEKFNYIATQNLTISSKFSNFSLIYYNKKTNVKLYVLKQKQWTRY